MNPSLSKKDGEPIFGLETNMTAVDRMTCGCARQAQTMRELGCAMKVKYDGNSPASQTRYSRYTLIRAPRWVC